MKFLKKVEAKATPKGPQAYIIKSVPSKDLGNGKHQAGMNAPGVLRWMIHTFGSQPKKARGILPLPDKIHDDLITGKIKWREENGDVVFEA